MSLIRVQTTWAGVAGSPYYTNLYALGPLATNNGNDLATAWRVFLNSTVSLWDNSLTAQISPELLEFNETDGTVTGAGTTSQLPVTGTSAGDALPPANQGLIRWSTAGIVHNRRVRGRTFLPGMMEANNEAQGVPSGAFVAAIDAAAETLLTTMTTRMRIWAQPHSEDPPNPNNPDRLGSAHAITGVSVAPYYAVLRSRRD
jgi:hypothetical protein